MQETNARHPIARLHVARPCFPLARGQPRLEGDRRLPGTPPRGGGAPDVPGRVNSIYRASHSVPVKFLAYQWKTV